VGYAFDRALLLYVTGGVAFVNLNTSDLFAGAGGTNIVTTSSDKTVTGWTVGGGAEYAIWQNWSVKAEYLYAGFGTVSSTTNSFSGFPASNITFSHRLSEQIARAGLNYQFH
jgi:outer membrane immunogenic protein